MTKTKTTGFGISTSIPAHRVAIALAYGPNHPDESQFEEKVAVELDRLGLGTDDLSGLCHAACNFAHYFPQQSTASNKERRHV